MEFTIFGYEGNPRTRILRIIAEVQGFKINLSEVVPRQNTNVQKLLEAFPRSNGKIPALQSADMKLTEVPAIAVYLSKVKPSSLLGDGSLEQEAEVLSWVNWANQELLGTLAKWFLPLIPGLQRPAPYDEAAVQAGKVASLTFLQRHEERMKDVEFLVGNDFTIADIFVALYIARGLEWVLGEEWRAQHPATMRHFERVAAWGPVKRVVPDFRRVTVETANQNPY